MDLLKNSENIVVFNVKKNGETLEEFLLSQKISGRFFRKLYKDKNVFINGKFERKNTLVTKGDIVSIKMLDEVSNTLPKPIPLDIVYENMDLLVLNKQPFIVVHETKSHQHNTISNGVSYYFKTKGINKKIRFINRLDMDTSGILLVAKSPFAHQQIALQFENNEVIKKYIVIVKGIVKKDKDIINLPIGRDEKNSIKKIVTPKGKEAITKYEVIERYDKASLLDIQIVTGRSHQIRVHLNHIGHPIIGDTLYYKPSEHIQRQALHSYYLKIKLPRQQENIELKAPIPDDISNLIDHFKQRKK